jgi:hypothetical protein
MGTRFSVDLVKVLYVYLADLVVAIHLAFVGFVVLGQLAIVVGAIARQAWARNFWLRTAHLLAIGIVVFETVAAIDCPLTIWERDLLKAAQLPVSERTFIGDLMHRVLIYDIPSEAFASGYYTFGAIVLLTFVLAPPRWPWKKKAPEGKQAVSQFSPTVQASRSVELAESR